MTRSFFSPVAMILTTAILLASGCVQQKRFRFVPAQTACFPETAKATPVAGPADQFPSLDCRSSLYRMAVIEFDENGRMADPLQEAAARKLIESEKARAKNGKIITVVYIHGWKNNASEAPPGHKPKDVEKFQGALLELGHRAAVAAGGEMRPAVPVVGIYMAWRGKTLMGPNWFTFASLWSRRNTANNIGDGPDLGAILDRYITLTNAGDDRSRIVLIGHSFGARVLEHAIESKDIRLHDDPVGDGVVRPRVDLVLYVNSANDSRLSMRRVQEYRGKNLRVRHPDFDEKECSGKAAPTVPVDPEVRATRCRDYPLLVAISSTGDAATRQLLPIANTINGDALTDALKKKIPPPPTGDEFADPTPDEGRIRKTAAAHFGFLQSHVAREIACPALPSAAPRDQGKTVEALIDDAVRRALATPEEDATRRKREAAEAERRRTQERARIERALHPVCSATDPSCRFVFRTLGDTPTCYQVARRQAANNRQPFNDTPYWIMNVAPTVMKDHGDIWNVSFVEMLGQLMAPRAFFEPTSERMRLRTEASK